METDSLGTVPIPIIGCQENIVSKAGICSCHHMLYEVIKCMEGGGRGESHQPTSNFVLGRRITGYSSWLIIY